MKKLLLFSFLLIGMIVLSCESDTENDWGLVSDETCNIPIEKRQTFWGDGETPWTSCQVANFKVFIEPCLSAENKRTWNSAIIEAFAMYNSVPNVGINITTTTTKSEADVTIDCIELDECIGGVVDEQSLMDKGYATKVFLNLNLDPSHSKCGDCPDTKFNIEIARWFVLHEFGHVLGFGHTNVIKPDSPLIPGTEIDTLSVYNSQVGSCNPEGVFSEGDINALQIKYPCDCSPDYIAASKMCLGSMQTICLDPGDREVTLYWDVNIPYELEEENCIKVEALTLEDIKISVTAYDNVCVYDFEKTIEVYSNEPCELIYVPPFEFKNICFGKEACFDFSTYGCLETLDIKSSSSKVVVDIDGSKVCISSLMPREEEVKLFVTPIGLCSDGAEVTWTIKVNSKDCGDDDVFGPF
ncbi:MAG: hypothetical protein AAGA77_25950 [Bacteroidota bacterium]